MSAACQVPGEPKKKEEIVDEAKPQAKVEE
jgi:hypothetical protein